jgi:hypothetical protein
MHQNHAGAALHAPPERRAATKTFHSAGFTPLVRAVIDTAVKV